YLEGTGKFGDRNYYPFPALILSDMNLSGESGNTFLEWLRDDPRFKGLPLVFLSGTFRISDRALAERLGATDFVVKTGDIAELCALRRARFEGDGFHRGRVRGRGAADLHPHLAEFCPGRFGPAFRRGAVRKEQAENAARARVHFLQHGMRADRAERRARALAT